MKILIYYLQQIGRQKLTVTSVAMYYLVQCSHRHGDCCGNTLVTLNEYRLSDFLNNNGSLNLKIKNRLYCGSGKAIFYKEISTLEDRR